MDGKFNVLLSKNKVLHTHFMIGHACWYYEIQIRNVTGKRFYLESEGSFTIFTAVKSIERTCVACVKTN